MSCEHCTDPDGLPCFPQYGLAPHKHKPIGTASGWMVTVQSPREEWPENFMEDPDEPGTGIYWCPHCGDGKPNAAESEGGDA